MFRILNAYSHHPTLVHVSFSPSSPEVLEVTG